MAYVTEYGNWGQDEILTFEPNLLSERQWEILDTLSDYDKLPYIKAIIAGENLDEWEEGFDA